MKEKDKKQLIILGVMVLVLIAAAAAQFKPKRRPAPGASAAPAQAVPETMDTLEQPVQARSPLYASATFPEREEQKKRAVMDWKRDPFFQSSKIDMANRSNLVLKGISYGRGAYALINDEILTAGDMVSGYKVTEVEKRKVRLQKGAEIFFLPLPEE